MTTDERVCYICGATSAETTIHKRRVVVSVITRECVFLCSAHLGSLVQVITELRGLLGETKRPPRED